MGFISTGMESGRERKRETRSDHFLSVLTGYSSAVVAVHDNPDPDAMAGGWAIVRLIEQKLQIKARLVGRGVITRAENVRFVELLEPPIELVERLDIDTDECAVVMVDCNPGGKNSILSGTGIVPLAVIDHHDPGLRPFRVLHRDIRTNAGASATIACTYLMEQNVEPNRSLATAILYALRADARGVAHAFSRQDLQVVGWLNDRVDHNKLNLIEAAPLEICYYKDLVCALQNAFVYQDVAVCFLPSASGPEIVGEVADLLIRCDCVNRVFCAANVDRSVMISVRTDDGGGEAATLLRQSLNGMGYSGGHGQRAGGRIIGDEATLTDERIAKLRKRFLAACGVDEKRGVRLVPRRTILESL